MVKFRAGSRGRFSHDRHPRAVLQTNYLCNSNPGSQSERGRSGLAPRRLRMRAATSLLYMPQCETCGNEYDKAMQVTVAGKSHWFDSFECAIHALAPACAHCGCKVIGHGAEAEGKFFCCAHCAKQEGVRGLDDRT